MMGGVVMSPEGKITINPINDRKVWEEIERLLDDKMGRGEFIVFDATFQSERDFKMPLQLANKHRYEVYCVDFTMIPQDVAQARNLQREPYKQVPESVVARAYDRFASSKIPQSVTAFPFTDSSRKHRLLHISTSNQWI